MPTIIDGSASATFATPLLLSQGGTGNTSGNVVSSQVAGALNATGSAPLYACRAWVNFNGTGTVAIRASGNVSSITDNGVGQYAVNFTTAMQDANYAVNGTISVLASGAEAIVLGHNVAPTASSAEIRVVNSSSQGYMDKAYVWVSIFR